MSPGASPLSFPSAPQFPHGRTGTATRADVGSPERPLLITAGAAGSGQGAAPTEAQTPLAVSDKLKEPVSSREQGKGD